MTKVEASIVIALDIKFLSVTPVFWLFKLLYAYAMGNCKDTLESFTDFGCIPVRLVFV